MPTGIYPRTKEFKRKRSEVAKKQWQNPEFREKMIRRMKGENNPMKNPEIAKKVSQAMKLLWQNPEYKEKMRKIFKQRLHGTAVKGTPKSEEWKQKMKEKWKNPEFREKMSERRFNIVWQRILKEIPELEKQGFRCIPIGKVIPDIIAFKDGKVFAIEVEYGNPKYDKYDEETRRYFDDIIWIIRNKRP
jgi:hypothetical protein